VGRGVGQALEALADDVADGGRDPLGPELVGVEADELGDEVGVAARAVDDDVDHAGVDGAADEARTSATTSSAARPVSSRRPALVWRARSANSSRSSGRSASPVRTVTTTRMAAVARCPARNARRRRLGTSAHWTSSTSTRSGRAAEAAASRAVTAS